MERLRNVPFHSLSRAVDMLCLNLGETVERFFERPKPDGQVRSVPSYSIHLQTQWRFVRNRRIVLASRDIYEPFAPDRVGEDWEYNLVGRPAVESSRFDVLSPGLSRRLLGNTVAACQISRLGDLTLEFSNGIRFESFTPSSLREELWRLVDYRKEEHLVVFDAEGPKRMAPHLVLSALEELSGWIGPDDSLEQAMEQLECYDELSAQELEKLKRTLSHDGVFHIKWLGDRWIPGFVGDGTPCAWWNYLHKIADICQKNL